MLNDTFFNEFTVRCPRSRRRRWSSGWRQKGVLGGVPAAGSDPGDEAELADLMLVAATETNTTTSIAYEAAA